MNAETAWAAGPLLRYRRRLIRKRLLLRAFRKRRDLRHVSGAVHDVPAGAILCFVTQRNEALRLPHFLDHYRGLGVDRFFFVDNDSDDGSFELLRAQPDVCLWSTAASYRGSRFGTDWLNWLRRRYAHGHWTVTVDVDEILVYPDWDRRGLKSLTSWLSRQGYSRMGAVMLDMYPEGPPGAQVYEAGEDPFDVVCWFDAHDYWAQRQPKLDNLWLQGGPRARVFFAATPERAPTLNKIPLVDWRRGHAFVNATHSALPSTLNHTWRTPVSGALLHTKFLPDAPVRARQERARDEHFQVGTRYADYYDAVARDVDLWSTASVRYRDACQLEDLGLISRGDW